MIVRPLIGLEAERDRERATRAEAESVLNTLRIEAATLSERAAHVEELRSLVKALQEREEGRAPKGRSKGEG